MTGIVVECLGVARSFGRGNRTIEALAPATCRVRAGDRIALMGPSGSGKSTLVHLMAGLDQPSAGDIRWPMLPGPDILRPGKVAVVFQSPSLMPALSVVENVELPLILGSAPGNTRGAAMNALTRIGVVILFFGVAFLLRYLAEIVTTRFLRRFVLGVDYSQYLSRCARLAE